MSFSSKFTIGNTIFIGELMPHYDLKTRKYLNELNVLKKELTDRDISIIMRRYDAFVGRAIVVKDGINNCFEFTGDEMINHIEDVKEILKTDSVFVYFFSFLINYNNARKNNGVLNTDVNPDATT